MFKLQGTIKVIKDTQQVSEKFSKRELVLIDNASMYPQDVLFELQQDQCSVLDAFKVGQQAEVSFDIRGREWTNPTTGEVKFFNTLKAFRVESLGSQSSPVAIAPEVIAEAGDDDLTF